jgi:two-component system sensor histidine kinase/response regulator
MEKIRQGKGVQNYETERVAKDGRLIEVSLTVSPTQDAAGNIIGASTITRDVTGRNRAEAERVRLAAAIEQCAETIIVTDPHGTIEYVNPAFVRVTGYSREEALGQNVRLIKSGKQNRAFLEDFWSTILAGKVWRGEMVNRRKDGSLYTDQISVTPVRDSDGKIVHFISAQLDVTERKHTEAENVRLATAINQAAEGVVITDFEAKIEYVNPAFERMTGYSRAEVLGENQRIPKSGVDDPVYDRIWKTLQGGEIWHGEVVNRRKDGTLYPEELTITPVRDADGTIINFIAVKQDITERKHKEQQLMQSLREKEVLL